MHVARQEVQGLLYMSPQPIKTGATSNGVASRFEWGNNIPKIKRKKQPTTSLQPLLVSFYLHI